MRFKSFIKRTLAEPLRFMLQHLNIPARNHIKILLPNQRTPVKLPLIFSRSLTFRRIFQTILDTAPERTTISIKAPKINSIIKLRSKTSDIPTFSQIFLRKDYNFPIPLEPKLIIDGGANVGYASLWFANKFPKAQIIAIEPETSNFEMLKLNTSRYSNIKPMRTGIWHKNTNLKTKPSNFDWSGKWDFQVEECKSKIEGSIQSVTIDKILEGSGFNQIDILKLDIEGSEKEVFSKGYEKWLDKVKILIIELHDHYKPGCSKAFYSAARQYDFKETRRGENVILIKHNL